MGRPQLRPSVRMPSIICAYVAILTQAGKCLSVPCAHGDDHVRAFERNEVVGIGFAGAHARRALGVIRQNVTLALVTKLAFLVSAAMGAAPLWLAVLADTGATVAVTLNGLRLLRVRSS